MLLLIISTLVISGYTAPTFDCIRSASNVSVVENIARRMHVKVLCKYTETKSSRDYAYCLYAPGVDLEYYAEMKSIRFWYIPIGSAVIELIFYRKGKFIFAYFEGFEDRKGRGMVSCHQFYGDHIDVGSNYQLLLNWDFDGNSEIYKDAFAGPIKNITTEYVRSAWKASEVFDGQIILNRDYLWYACNLFAKLVGIEVNELMANPNITEPIIQHKMAEGKGRSVGGWFGNG